MKKVKAKITAVIIEPEYEITFKCPHCKHKHTEDAVEVGISDIRTCENKECKKKFELEIPEEE